MKSSIFLNTVELKNYLRLRNMSNSAPMESWYYKQSNNHDPLKPDDFDKSYEHSSASSVNCFRTIGFYRNHFIITITNVAAYLISNVFEGGGAK